MLVFITLFSPYPSQIHTQYIELDPKLNLVGPQVKVIYISAREGVGFPQSPMVALMLHLILL